MRRTLYAIGVMLLAVGAWHALASQTAWGPGSVVRAHVHRPRLSATVLDTAQSLVEGTLVATDTTSLFLVGRGGDTVRVLRREVRRLDLGLPYHPVRKWATLGAVMGALVGGAIGYGVGADRCTAEHCSGWWGRVYHQGDVIDGTGAGTEGLVIGGMLGGIVGAVVGSHLYEYHWARIGTETLGLSVVPEEGSLRLSASVSL